MKSEERTTGKMRYEKPTAINVGPAAAAMGRVARSATSLSLTATAPVWEVSPSVAVQEEVRPRANATMELSRSASVSQPE